MTEEKGRAPHPHGQPGSVFSPGKGNTCPRGRTHDQQGAPPGKKIPHQSRGAYIRPLQSLMMQPYNSHFSLPPHLTAQLDRYLSMPTLKLPMSVYIHIHAPSDCIYHTQPQVLSTPTLHTQCCLHPSSTSRICLHPNSNFQCLSTSTFHSQCLSTATLKPQVSFHTHTQPSSVSSLLN